MADIERTCDGIVVLRDGRLAESGEVGNFTRESETVFIEVDFDRDRLSAALEQRGVAVVQDGRGLYVEGADETIYDLIRAALVETEVPLRRMAPRRQALTELFRQRRSEATSAGPPSRQGFNPSDGPQR
jgi:ABC-type uncharacterized transport system ATPase subunit